MEFLLPQVFIVYISSLVARLNTKNKKLVTNSENYNNIFVWIVIIYLICISGFRVGVGTDYWTYKEMYEIWAPNARIEGTSDIGFLIFIKLLHNISMNSQLMFMVTSIIINVCIILTIKKYSTKFELSMYFYITTFVYYATFNAVRQTMAIAIVFAATKYLIERKRKQYIFIVIVASFIHQSILIMIPVYFLVNNKFKSKTNLYVCIVFVLSFLFYDGFLESLFNILDGSNYAGYKEVVSSSAEGANIFRFLVQLVPIALIFVYSKSIVNDDDKEFNIMLNMSLLGTLFMLLALKHWLFARLTTIFNLYSIIVIPKILDGCKNKKMKILLCYTMMICYFLFALMLLRNGESNILPYRWTTKIL